MCVGGGEAALCLCEDCLPSALPMQPALTFLLKEQPSVKRALPPVGWHSISAHAAQMTRVVAWEKMTVMLKQVGQRTSMKKLLGLCRGRGGGAGAGRGGAL